MSASSFARANGRSALAVRSVATRIFVGTGMECSSCKFKCLTINIVETDGV